MVCLHEFFQQLKKITKAIKNQTCCIACFCYRHIYTRANEKRAFPLKLTPKSMQKKLVGERLQHSVVTCKILALIGSKYCSVLLNGQKSMRVNTDYLLKLFGPIGRQSVWVSPAPDIEAVHENDCL